MIGYLYYNYNLHMLYDPNIFSCIYYSFDYIITVRRNNGEMPAGPGGGFSRRYLTIYCNGFNIILIYNKKSMTGMINNEVPREGAVW